MYLITVFSNSARPLILGSLASLLWLSACQSDNLRVPLENDGTPPGVVTNVQVENLPGGARIVYSVPPDRDLLKVVAEYEIRPGIKQQSVCSAFGHEVLLQGFGSLGTYTAKLYAVDKSDNWSDPVTVTVNPLQPPVRFTYESLDYEAYFGGLLVKFDNPSQADLVVTTMVKDPISGEWVDYDKNFTQSEGGHYFVGGLPPSNAEFGLFVKDQWDNFSDTLVKRVTPLLEVDLNAIGNPSFYLLPGDNTSQAAAHWDLGAFFSGQFARVSRGFANYTNSPLPQTLTIDFGAPAKISRFKTWQIGGNRVYQESNVKDFELWGSNDPNPNGEYDSSWFLLGRYTVKKPSGLPYGQVNSVDIATAAGGDEFLMDPGVPVARYIRLKILSTFTTPEGSSGLVWLVGFNAWGQFMP